MKLSALAVCSLWLVLNSNSAPCGEIDALNKILAASDHGNTNVQNTWEAEANNENLDVSQDYTEVVKRSRKAAEQGNANAQGLLGSMYFQGLGVPKDCQEAVRWFRSAAEQGHANSQILLGFLYYQGREVPQDHKESLRWYKMAADQGYYDAQLNLWVAYFPGLGEIHDFEESYSWLIMVAANGDTNAKKNMESLRTKMTPAQIKSAQKMAKTRWMT